MLLSAVGIAILNFAPSDDPVALASGIAFTFVALIAIAYAAGTFLRRAMAIRCVRARLTPLTSPSRRQAINFHDRYGPTALCVILLAAVALNFILRFTEGPHRRAHVML